MYRSNLKFCVNFFSERKKIKMEITFEKLGKEMENTDGIALFYADELRHFFSGIGKMGTKIQSNPG